MPFFLPHSLAKPSIHLSYSGMKWLHCRIFKVLVSASALETKGADTAGARAEAPAKAPAVLRSPRRVVFQPSAFSTDRMVRLLHIGSARCVELPDFQLPSRRYARAARAPMPLLAPAVPMPETAESDGEHRPLARLASAWSKITTVRMAKWWKSTI